MTFNGVDKPMFHGVAVDKVMYAGHQLWPVHNYYAQGPDVEMTVAPGHSYTITLRLDHWQPVTVGLHAAHNDAANAVLDNAAALGMNWSNGKWLHMNTVGGDVVMQVTIPAGATEWNLGSGHNGFGNIFVYDSGHMFNLWLHS